MDDELFHPVGRHPAWSESYYFNFVDPVTQVGAFTRMGFRPNDGWADALHAVYLPGGRVAFTYGRRTDVTPASLAAMGDADLEVGELTLRRGEPFDRWELAYDGSAQDLADPTVLLLPTAHRPAGSSVRAPLRMAITFRALAEPHYAARGERGHFEQTGRARGWVELGEQRWEVDAYGVRDKSWGPRTWQASSGSGAGGSGTGGSGAGGAVTGCFLNWFSMNFGPGLALGGACVREADGTFRGAGWLQRDGENLELEQVTMRTELDPANPLLHRRVWLHGIDSSGTALAIEGEVLSICPTKIPARNGVTFVNEGLARFVTADGAVGYGIAEHWFAVPR
ncbi:MAG: hypothetical protein R2749_01640 [Acidimicrobiales bacterium]